jgi:membrane-bound serine protease (ClpP class)
MLACDTITSARGAPSTMVLTIAIIVLFGLLLMMLETFVPGWIAGGIGVLCLITAVILALTSAELATWPNWGRTALACGIVIGSVGVLLAWMRFFAVKFWRRNFTLEAEIQSPSTTEHPQSGEEGIALTELRPLGRAEISGKRCEVRCEDGFAPAGSRLRVTGSEPGNLLVRLLS